MKVNLDAFDFVNFQTVAVNRQPSHGSQVMPATHHNDKGDLWEGDLLHFNPDLHIHVFLYLYCTSVPVLVSKRGSPCWPQNFQEDQ